LSRHDDVEQALVDWQTFSSSRGDILELIQSGIEMPPGVILFEDPPLHTMHRGLMSRVFTPRRMNALETKVREYCAQCLDPLVGRDRFDFVADLGSEMPMRVIGMLLGIPESDQAAIRNQADANLRTEAGMPMEVSEGFVAGELFEEYIDWRAKNPSDDLMTELLNAEFEDENGEIRTLTRQEVLTYTQVLAGAGNETTGRLIGWLGKVLGDHPDQRRQIVADGR
jgi:cytochrome P450